MKNKVILLGLTICAGLSLGLALGCSGKEEVRERTRYRSPQEPNSVRQRPAAKPPVKKEEATDAAITPMQEQGMMPSDSDIDDADTVCTPGQDDACVLIPRDGCFGCMKEGDGHVAVNKEAAKRIMMPRKDECLPQIKDMMKNPEQAQNQKPSNDPSCRYNKAVCSDAGRCELGQMTQEEMQKMQEQMESAQRQMGQRDNGGSTGQGMQPNMR